MSFGAHSEVGRLRKVMVHRPGLEHTRLTPSNAEDLLFDDVLWVARAKAEHDMFCEAMRDRGVEVFEAEQLLTEALVKPETKDWVCEHILNERQVGITASQAGPGVGGERRCGAGGGVPHRRDHQSGRGPGRRAAVGSGRSDQHAAAAAAELPVPARPVLLDLRRGDLQSHDQTGPQTGNHDRRGHLPVPSDVRGGVVPGVAGRLG